MISYKPVISITVTAIYEKDKLINYVLLERQNDHTVQSFFLDKAAMKQHIKDLIRSI